MLAALSFARATNGITELTDPPIVAADLEITQGGAVAKLPRDPLDETVASVVNPAVPSMLATESGSIITTESGTGIRI